MTLSYNGISLVDVNARPGDAFSVAEYNLGGTAGWGGSGYTANWDGSTLTWFYSWGNVKCQYSTPAGTDRLVVTITVTNVSSQTLNGINIYPFGVQFPTLPQNFGASNYPQFHNNLDGPSLISADYGMGMTVLANADAQPLFLGFSPSGPTNHYGLLLGTLGNSNEGFLASAVPVSRPIPAGQAAVYSFSLRFAPSGTDYHSIAGDVLTTFGQTWPQALQWSDRRPIGELFMTAPTSTPISNTSPNPRNYTVAANINIQTSQGLAAFQQSVGAYADNAINILKKMNAQGAIVWDLEGQQYPQPNTSYVGDPSLLPTMAPEMDSVADAFFQKFRNAGLRCGMTIRPQTMNFSISPPNQDLVPIQNQASVLIQKIQYAYNRWGCTLFYVDSDGGPYDSTAPSSFRQVLQALPNVLVIPENVWIKDYAYSAPLASFTAPYKPLHTPADALTMWPRAFSVTYVGDAPNGDLTNNPNNPNQFNQFVQAVKNGDILSFRAWFDDEPLNDQVQQIYQMAGVTGVSSPPTVGITSPAPGATVSGAVTVSANAMANAGIAQVQFQVDGNNISSRVVTAPYSVSWNTTAVENGSHTLTAVAQDTTGASAISAGVPVTVSNPAIPHLNGSVQTPSGAQNLTTLGTTDWAHWGLTGPTSFDHKANVSQQISNFHVVGGGSVLGYSNNPVGYTWTDGIPNISSTGTTTGIYISGQNHGFTITAPADTTPRTLTVYVGVWMSQGKMLAHLSDNSSPDYVDTSLQNSSGTTLGQYMFNYQAASAGQTFSVTFTQNNATGGNVTLQAAALQASVVVTPPAADFSISATPGTASVAPGANSAFTVNSATTGGFNGSIALSVTGMPSGATSAFNPTTILGTGSSTLTITVPAGSASGTYPLTITATSGALIHKATVILTVTAPVQLPSSGSLTGSVQSPSGSVNLTTLGTTDWAHWGLTGPTSFDHKANVSQQISNFKPVGDGIVANYSNNPVAYSWTDGTPYVAVGGSTTGIYVGGQNNGFTITVPADTTPRTLTLYVGVWMSQGKFLAHLSDGSAADYVDSSLLNTLGTSSGQYTLHFNAGSAGQTLTVTFTQSNASNGNVTLQAATLASQ